MDIFVLMLIVVCCWGLGMQSHNSEYLGRESTTAIKGVFAIFIIFSHGRGYITQPIDDCSRLFYGLSDMIGQLMVVMFLLYSGYGIVETYKRKRRSYIHGFIRRRILKTLVHFDIAVLLFVILAALLGHEYPVENILLSFTGWLDVGNSNWFIFDIIILYVITLLGLIAVERKNWNLKHFLLIMFMCSMAFSLIMYKVKPLWWSDTIMAFPTGMLWSVYKPNLDDLLKVKRNYILFSLSALFVFVILTFAGRHIASVFSMFASAIFGILIILVTMRLRVGNQVLHWLGINAFSIYILQRIPMILASEYGINANPVTFMTIVTASSVLIAWGYTKFTDNFDRKFFS